MTASATKRPLIALTPDVHERSGGGLNGFLNKEYTDAVLAAGGIPSVVFGPGAIAQAHTADEWVSLRSLETATRLLVSFLRTLP